MTTKVRMYTTGVHAMMYPYKMSVIYSNGSKKQNLDYCTKEEGRIDGPWFVNPDAFASSINGKQGKRTDIDNFTVMVIEEGGITNEVIEQYPGHAARYGRHARDVIHMLKTNKMKQDEVNWWKERRANRLAGKPVEDQRQRKMVLLFGPTAVGKTTMVKDKVQGKRELPLFEKNCDNIWWDGYEDEAHVLMDEFRGDRYGPIDSLNRITNIGVVQVEIKGGMKPLVAEQIWMTTNRHPSHWWKKKNDTFYNWSDATYRAVARRFAKVYWWNDAGEMVKLKNPGKAPRLDADEETQDNWEVANEKWLEFWKWHQRPIREGDTGIPSGENNYFTLI